MPKHDILLKPGEKAPRNIQAVIDTIFSEKDLRKLERFGGRIQINLTAPFVNRNKQDKNLVVTEELVEKIKASPNPQIILEKLTIKKLRQVAKVVQYPISSKATSKEIMNGIVSFITSREKWQNVSSC